jgi:DNA invertase Pin-like site-specific DNA recombinase
MKAVLYARVSSDSQDVDLSISGQLRAIRDYATKHECQVVREYIDEAESGRTADRPAFREMIALARTKHAPFEAILVWKLNRFARNRIVSITYKKLLRDRGIRVISINEPLEDNPSGHMFEGVIEVMDEFYSENLGQDIKRGMRENAERGFYNGSKVPYGYHKTPVNDNGKTRHKLAPDPEDSVAVQTIRTIFNMALKRVGCKEIAKTLNRDGFLTSTGQRWGKTTVHKVLNNEAHCGTLVWGGRPEHSAIRSKTPPVRVENAWPAIIDRETFNAVQQRMAANAPRAVHPRTVPSFYLLSGLLHCSCGRAMIGRSAKSHRHYYYSCNRSFKQGKDACGAKNLPKGKLENIVIGRIKERILTPECMEGLVRLVNEDLDSTNGRLKDRLDVIDAELNDVRARLARLYDVLETRKLNLDDLAPRLRELKARQNELSKTRVLTEAEMVAQGVQHVDVETVKAYAQDLRTVLEEADFTESKTFLRSFVNRIVISENKATVHYKMPLPPDGKRTQAVEVLPIDTLGGPWGTRTRRYLDTFDSAYQSRQKGGGGA